MNSYLNDSNRYKYISNDFSYDYDEKACIYLGIFVTIISVTLAIIELAVL